MPIGLFIKEKNILPLPRFKPLDLPALSGVTKPTTLHRLITKNQLTEDRLLGHGISADNKDDAETASVAKFIQNFELNIRKQCFI